MIHIVFQAADVEVLKEAMALDSALQGEIIQIRDDFAVGPIQDLFTEEGRLARAHWWRAIAEGGDYEGIRDNGSVPDDHQTVRTLTERLHTDPSESLWIWVAPNKHDVSGYYWLISQLKEFPGRTFILFLNNLPFINTKGNIFYPENLFEIPAREFLKAKKLARPVTPSEFEVDPDEWQRLANEGKSVRILEGAKKLQSYDADYFDASLKNFIGPDWQKASRVIHQFLSKAKQTTGDLYLLWRLKQIIGSGDFDVQGEVKKMKDFEIRRKVKEPEPDMLNNE